MDRLTREEIVEAFRLGKVHCSTQTFNALCDMALHSLESVRSEALAYINHPQVKDMIQHGRASRQLINLYNALSPARVAEGDDTAENYPYRGWHD